MSKDGWKSERLTEWVSAQVMRYIFAALRWLWDYYHITGSWAVWLRGWWWWFLQKVGMTRTSCIYIILSVYVELSDRSLLLLLWTDVKQRLWLSQSVLWDVAPSSKCNLYASADISVRWHKGCWILMAKPGRITRPAAAHYVIITLAFQMTGGVPEYLQQHLWNIN